MYNCTFNHQNENTICQMSLDTYISSQGQQFFTKDCYILIVFNTTFTTAFSSHLHVLVLFGACHHGSPMAPIMRILPSDNKNRKHFVNNTTKYPSEASLQDYQLCRCQVTIWLWTLPVLPYFDYVSLCATGQGRVGVQNNILSNNY